jgi:hypothetical protein
LISLLLLTLVISLKITTAQVTDSVTCIPNSQLKGAIKEILDGRACSVERELLYNNIQLYTDVIANKDSIITSKVAKETSFKRQIAAQREVEQIYKIEIDAYKKQLRRNRNKMIGIGVGGITVTLGLVALGTYIAIVR